ncbi:MAG: hypothetical protein E7277_00330 [Lachnospiraceae bacterium]|nr:hypothetical protein [Lachnospiraceae bacterium]
MKIEESGGKKGYALKMTELFFAKLKEDGAFEIFSYETQYERCVEEIEGTATYMEWMVLKQLNAERAAAYDVCYGKNGSG